MSDCKSWVVLTLCEGFLAEKCIYFPNELDKGVSSVEAKAGWYLLDEAAELQSLPMSSLVMLGNSARFVLMSSILRLPGLLLAMLFWLFYLLKSLTWCLLLALDFIVRLLLPR